jgi:hypothetical protein
MLSNDSTSTLGWRREPPESISLCEQLVTAATLQASL